MADFHDTLAEQAVLGAVLLAPELAGPVLLALPADAWWHPRHQAIAAVLTGRLRRNESVDPVTVLGELTTRKAGADIGPYLLTLIENTPTPANATFYADRIRELAAARRLHEAAQRAQQRLDQPLDVADTLAATVRDLRTACDATEQVLTPEADTPSPTLADLLAAEDHHDWLVPGLLERAERIILTGAEGHGKSMLCAQFACALAAGLHPFTGNLLGADRHHLRVLVVDAENNPMQTRRRYRRIAQLVDELRVGASPLDWRASIRFEIRPEGLDLLGRDTSWLERRVASVSPDLLLIGPIYKLHAANINDESAARDLAVVLDGIRTRHGCALLSEAHAGHALDPKGTRQLRPAGSSLFLRWPEFGFGISRAPGAEGEHPEVVRVIAWRGSREERHWPRELRHGQAHNGELPWTPGDAYYRSAA